ncbi:MAG: hypothetical protein ACYTGX_08675 [Planctomycetota bacterium]|jgi:hypothetical protein
MAQGTRPSIIALLAAATVLGGTASALAQAPPPDPRGTNNAFVDFQRPAAQLLKVAKRSEAAAPEVCVDAYSVLAEQFAEADPAWVVPTEHRDDPQLPAWSYVGVHLALLLQLRNAAQPIRAAWRRRYDAPSLAAARAAGHDHTALAAVARRWPLTAGATRALRILGDLHLERGAVGRAIGCYRRAGDHRQPELPPAPALRRRIDAAERLMQPAATPPLGTLPLPARGWFGEAATATARRTPAIAPHGVILADATWVRALSLDGPNGPLSDRWMHRDADAEAQAKLAARQDRQARQTTPGWGRRREGELKLPKHGIDLGEQRPVVAGGIVVALLGRPAPAARALESSVAFRQNRRRWGRAFTQWDGVVPPARHLVALRLQPDEAGAPVLIWRAGGEAGVPGLSRASDFAGSPVASGGDVVVGALTTGNEIAAHVVTLRSASGEPRSVVYLAGGQREVRRGQFSGMLRVPPAVAASVIDGQAIVCSNLGVIAACDAETGDVRWLRRYPQGASPADNPPNRGVAPPFRAPDGIVVAPWDADHIFLLDPATGAERRRWPIPEGKPLRLLGVTAQGAPVGLHTGNDGPADQVLQLSTTGGKPSIIAIAPPGEGWLDARLRDGAVWLAGPHSIDRVDLATGDWERVYWFGRDRPETVALEFYDGGLAVATDRTMLWFPIGR